MPEEPTYREEPMGERTIYTCLVPDAGREEGICGHKTIDEGFMTQHQQQMHRGVMVKEEPSQSGDAAAPGVEVLSPPAETATSPESPPSTPEPAEEPA